MYDAIVVGARCAGSPLSMLLARKGYRVLMVDKSVFPSDTISTHHIHQPGVAKLKQWGLLKKIQASHCPPTRTFRFDVGPITLVGTPPPAGDTADAYAPRRYVLDNILVYAAIENGVEFREGFTVDELTTDGKGVTGIRGRGRHGGVVQEKARIVVGADGARSIVARTVDAPVTHDRGMITCNYYTYWSGVPLDGVEIYSRAGGAIVADQTNDGLTMVTVMWPIEKWQTVRTNIEGEYWKAIWEIAPSLAIRLENGNRAERFYGTGYLPNFLRKPYGTGWALVGDAGYHKDPFTSQGITDSFRHAELLAELLHEAFAGRRELQSVLEEYEQRRNEEVMPMFEHTVNLARMQPPTPEMTTLFNALQGNKVETGRFMGTLAGTVPLSDFFSPENIGRIIEESSLVSAV